MDIYIAIAFWDSISKSPAVRAGKDGGKIELADSVNMKIGSVKGMQ